MSESRRRLIGVALTLGIAPGFAACGSSSGDDADGPTGDPLKLMAVFESTGASASPEVPEGAIAAAKAINADGGIDGRPVEIIPCDTKNDPNAAAECGRQAVSEGVLAMVGNLTIYADRFMPIAEQHKIASIGLEPATATDFTSPASFPIAGGAPVVFAGLAAALADNGATKIVLARLDIPEAAAVADFANFGLERFGLKMRDLPVPVGAPDMAPYAAAALQDGTDGIVVSQADQDAVNFVRAVRQADSDVKIALIATSLGDVLEALGPDAEGIIQTASATIALRNEAERRYEQDMKAAGYDNITGFRLASYASVRLFEQIAADLPTISAEAVFDALSTGTNFDVGFTPPLDFREGGVAGLPRVFNPCLFATRIVDGEQVPITGQFADTFTGTPCPTPD